MLITPEDGPCSACCLAAVQVCKSFCDTPAGAVPKLTATAPAPTFDTKGAKVHV